MKIQKANVVHLALLGWLMGLGSTAYPAEDDVMTRVLPLCSEQSLGLQALAGDTLDSLVQRMAKPDAISDDEWVNLIYERNPNAFQNNKDSLSAGAVLFSPCFEALPALKEQSEAIDLAPTIQKTETELIQIRQLAESQTREIRQFTELTENQTKMMRQFVESQATALSIRAEQLRSSMFAMLGLAGLILTLFIVLGVCLYRWNRSSATTASQALPRLEKIEQLLPGLGVKIEKAESRILQRMPNGGAGDEAPDASALRDYLKRLVPVDIAIADFMRDGGAESEALKVIKALAEDALDSCGVETFAPEIGEDYRRAEGVADYPKTRVTDKPEDKFKIVEILEKGYRMRTPEGFDVIYPARVRIFTTN